jgi:hypothetical protein
VRMARRAVAAVIPPDEEEVAEDDEEAYEPALDEEVKNQVREGEFEPGGEVRS